MSFMFDLHTHSRYSDGTDTPAEIVRKSKQAGLALIAITDHDTVEGVPEAVREGETRGVAVLPGIEINTESPFELHILGLGIAPDGGALSEVLLALAQSRRIRNGEIEAKLRKAGIRLPAAENPEGNTTRLHFAVALREAGYAKSVHEAFEKYLSESGIAYCPLRRLQPEEAIAWIHAAGGIAVLAHPCLIKGNPIQIVSQLAARGLDGLEAFYPSATPGQTELFLSLARQKRLLVTCGSDYHGANRRDAALGCTWNDKKELMETERFLKSVCMQKGSARS